jgi:hypothetical protein
MLSTFGSDASILGPLNSLISDSAKTHELSSSHASDKVTTYPEWPGLSDDNTLSTLHISAIYCHHLI